MQFESLPLGITAICIARMEAIFKRTPRRSGRVTHQTRALSQNVTNAPEGALTPNLKNVTVQNK